MTTEEFNKIYEANLVNLKERMEKEREMESRGEALPYSSPFMIEKHSSFGLYDGMEVQEIQDGIKEFLEDLEKKGLTKKSSFKVQYVLDMDSDGRVDRNCVEACWQEFREQPEIFLKQKAGLMAKDTISDKMFEEIKSKVTSGYKYKRQPDCAILSLFRDGVLSYEKLLEITYKDCML